MIHCHIAAGRMIHGWLEYESDKMLDDVRFFLLVILLFFWFSRCLIDCRSFFCSRNRLFQ
jgi:hypothetical protein